MNSTAGVLRERSAISCYQIVVYVRVNGITFYFYLFYLYIYPPDWQESDGGANT